MLTPVSLFRAAVMVFSSADFLVTLAALADAAVALTTARLTRSGMSCTSAVTASPGLSGAPTRAGMAAPRDPPNAAAYEEDWTPGCGVDDAGPLNEEDWTPCEAARAGA